MKFLVCSRLSEHRYKTPEGYLVCVDSILSRTGKQTYSRDELFKDGCADEVEVERSAEEVFSEKTLASFENKPLTIEHPEEDVTPANHNKYSVGFIRDIKRGKDGSEDVMLGTIVVTDAEAIELIETGKLKELSCGYDCDIEDEDNPQQRNIRGNHVALCEKGRAGIARIVDSVKDEVLKRGKTYVAASGAKLTVDDIEVGYSDYNGEPFMTIYYSYVSASGKKKGKSKCSSHDFWSMMTDRSKTGDEAMTDNVRLPRSEDAEVLYKDAYGNEIIIVNWDGKHKYMTIHKGQELMMSEEEVIKYIDKCGAKFVRTVRDGVDDTGRKVFMVHSGYAIVVEKHWRNYKSNAFVERICHSLDAARYERSSLERCDGISFVIVDCNNNAYKVVDHMKKDMKVSHDNIRERPVFVMQSDVDKNLFFYIGKTHAMKEGEWTYTQYDMEGMTPDELRKELEANGWHKVARGPAPFIDADPYKESSEGLEKAEKNLHDEMICNTETDCKDELQTFRIGFDLDITVDVKATDIKSALEKAKSWAKANNYDYASSFREVRSKGDRHFQIDACNDADKYRVGQTVLYKGKKVKISKVEHDNKYGYDLLIPNPDYDGSDSRYEFIWVGENVKTIDACKDAYHKTVRTTYYSIPAFKHGSKYSLFAYNRKDLSYEDLQKIASRYNVKIALENRLGQYGYVKLLSDDKNKICKAFAEIDPEHADLKILDSTNDASDNAYRKVQTILSKNPQFKGKLSKQEFDTGEIMIDFADYKQADKFVAECRRMGLRCREGYFGPDTTILVRDAATNDAKTEYVFNYRDTYHGTQDKMRVDANNLDEAIRKFGDTMALGGFGTANIYVVSVSPNDGYMRAYGKLSEMLKQKWTRDSTKKLDSKKLLSIVKIAKSIKSNDDERN